MKKAKSDYLIQSVSRALDILEAFTANEGELGVTELSRRLKLHKNNVFRLLATLETRGYVEQDKESGNYRLGMKTFEVANIFTHHLGLVRQARPVLDQLAQVDRRGRLPRRPGRTLRGLRRHGGHRPAGAGRPASRPAPARARDGAREGAARVPLPRRARGDVEARRAGERDGPDARRAVRASAEELARVAEREWALEDEELEPGVRGLAAPIRDYARRVVGAIGMRGPAFRLPLERLETELAPRVRAAARDVSKRLGFAVIASQRPTRLTLVAPGASGRR